MALGGAPSGSSCGRSRSSRVAMKKTFRSYATASTVFGRHRPARNSRYSSSSGTPSRTATPPAASRDRDKRTAATGMRASISIRTGHSTCQDSYEDHRISCRSGRRSAVWLWRSRTQITWFSVASAGYISKQVAGQIGGSGGYCRAGGGVAGHRSGAGRTGSRLRGQVTGYRAGRWLMLTHDACYPAPRPGAACAGRDG